MLKKLVRYGNSHALVLDKAILELLNITEGSVVKLHTDGKSLVITPEKAASQPQAVFMGGLEKLHAGIKENTKKWLADITTNPVKKEQLENFHNSEAAQKLQDAYKKISLKYKADREKLDSDAFLKDVDNFIEHYRGDKSSPEFAQELLALRLKHAPNLANMDREMIEAQKTAGITNS